MVLLANFSPIGINFDATKVFALFTGHDEGLVRFDGPAGLITGHQVTV